MPSKRKPSHQPPALGPRKKPTRARPLKGKPGVARPYDHGFPPPPEKSPWVDEGRPESAG
jgi:hypothetical protein